MASKKSPLKLILTATAREDLAHWEHSNPKIVQKINAIFESILANPEKGIGTPEKLKYELVGSWSRRINRKDRVVYDITNDSVIILQLRDHY